MGNQIETFGYLRETKESAKEAGIDPVFNLPRTGLDEYLSVIYPDVTDWIHDRTIPESTSRSRPDYRSESLKLIVEFDGFPHYQRPEVIKKDKELTKLYQNLGYKVVRIPFFIQLSNKVVKDLFGVDVDINLFDDSIPSLDPKLGNTPAYLSSVGVKRMAEDFKLSPKQYGVNTKYLDSLNDEDLTGVSILRLFYIRNTI